ncbi:MAG: hypothetical protein IJ228_05190 [Succinivibrio sp.]|nr:hypothetical protein [Succinivibrio sp.]
MYLKIILLLCLTLWTVYLLPAPELSLKSLALTELKEQILVHGARFGAGQNEVVAYLQGEGVLPETVRFFALEAYAYLLALRVRALWGLMLPLTGLGLCVWALALRIKRKSHTAVQLSTLGLSLRLKALIPWLWGIAAALLLQPYFSCTVALPLCCALLMSVSVARRSLSFPL